MLHYKTIDNKTLDLLRQLLSVPEFSKLRLVDGTSLALQIGHRKSVDIDLFGHIDADEDEMPIMINPIHWDHVKKLITSSVESYIKK